MRIMNLLYKILLIIAVIIMCSSSICYADNLNPDLDKFEPTADLGAEDGKAMNIIETILSVLMVLGIIATVIGLALIGFNSILGSASEKAISQEKYVGIVIAALIIVGASTLAKFIMNFAQNI